MHYPQGLIAFLDRINYDPEGNLVIYLFERNFLGYDFFINGVKMLGTADYFAIGKIYLGKFAP